MRVIAHYISKNYLHNNDGYLTIAVFSQDICISAVKEQEIESKLKQIIAEWATVDLQFSTFKQRGELLLKGVETIEIISQLEDSLMVISSLMANRYEELHKNFPIFHNSEQ